MAERQTEPAAVDSSLLVSRPTCSADNAAFDLGISLSESPPRKKKCLSLQRKRFGNPIESPERLTAARGVVPVNTEASTQWALKHFHAWAQNRSAQETEAAVPVDLLRCHDAGLVCKWMCRFVIETRKTDGSAYLPATLRSLVSGLNREIQRNKAPFSVLDKNDARFRDLQKTLDSLSSELHRQGLGATHNSAKVIDPVHEELFWKKSLFGYSSPKILQRTVFFYVGLNFVLCGVQEQYDVVPSQFVRFPMDTHVYNETSGHRSTKALRFDERTCVEQQQAVTNRMLSLHLHLLLLRTSLVIAH